MKKENCLNCNEVNEEENYCHSFCCCCRMKLSSLIKEANKAHLDSRACVSLVDNLVEFFKLKEKEDSRDEKL